MTCQSILYPFDIRFEKNMGNILSPAFRKQIQDEAAQFGIRMRFALGVWRFQQRDQLR
jgi:hypothetical protein